jgi:hypothetical protein
MSYALGFSLRDKCGMHRHRRVSAREVEGAHEVSRIRGIPLRALVKDLG